MHQYLRDRLRAGAFAVLVIATFVVPRIASAQQHEGRRRVIVARVEEANSAPSCACQSDIPVPNDRSLYIVAIGARWPLAVSAGERVRLSWAGDLLPLVISNGTADSSVHFSFCQPHVACGYVSNDYPWTTNSYGAGLLPLGLQLDVHAARFLDVSARAAGGAVRLSTPVPYVDGHKFNFMAEGEVSADLHLTRRLALSTGVTINHISNGHTAPVNAGMNTMMMSFGLALRR